jgi:RimJ/RimL family protein N-acetyltransferase
VTLHGGQTYQDGAISIGPADQAKMLRAAAGSDVERSIVRWLAAAERDDSHYFAIYQRGEPVGQIFLHDVNWATREGLVGYHLFRPSLRGRGTGTCALCLLQRFVQEETELTELIAITTRDNIASQTIAQRCGFRLIGPSREDPVNGIVFRWRTED